MRQRNLAGFVSGQSFLIGGVFIGRYSGPSASVAVEPEGGPSDGVVHQGDQIRHMLSLQEQEFITIIVAAINDQTS